MISAYADLHAVPMSKLSKVSKRYLETDQWVLYLCNKALILGSISSHQVEPCTHSRVISVIPDARPFLIRRVPPNSPHSACRSFRRLAPKQMYACVISGDDQFLLHLLVQSCLAAKNKVGVLY